MDGYISNQDSSWPIITNNIPRDWSFIMGRGGYKMGVKKCVRKYRPKFSQNHMIRNWGSWGSKGQSGLLVCRLYASINNPAYLELETSKCPPEEDVRNVMKILSKSLSTNDSQNKCYQLICSLLGIYCKYFTDLNFRNEIVWDTYYHVSIEYSKKVKLDFDLVITSRFMMFGKELVHISGVKHIWQ